MRRNLWYIGTMVEDDPTSAADLLARFEDTTLPNERFHHADHVRVAWEYLERHPPLEALGRFTAALRRYATAHGAPEKYHETITVAYLFLIAERRARLGAGHSWAEFAAANADVLRWKGGVLERYYRPGTLGSDLARRIFVLPDAAVAAP